MTAQPVQLAQRPRDCPLSEGLLIYFCFRDFATGGAKAKQQAASESGAKRKAEPCVAARPRDLAATLVFHVEGNPHLHAKNKHHGPASLLLLYGCRSLSSAFLFLPFAPSLTLL